MENGKANLGSNPKGRPRVVVVGSGFAGFTCARELERRLRPEDAELVLASPTDYLLYSPLLPEVATGVIDPLLRRGHPRGQPQGDPHLRRLGPRRAGRRRRHRQHRRRQAHDVSTDGREDRRRRVLETGRGPAVHHGDDRDRACARAGCERWFFGRRWRNSRGPTWSPECANRRGRLGEPEPREGRSDVVSTTTRSVKGSTTNRQTTRRRRA